MRTETKTTKIYMFAELSDKAKEVARDWFRECLDVEDWNYPVEDAANVGIKITGYDIGRRNDIDGTIEDTEVTAHAILKEHGAMCETYKTAMAYLSERDAIVDSMAKDEAGDFKDEQDLDDKLEEAKEDFTKSILKDYLDMLRKEYEYIMSDESVDENIEANEYEFTGDGKRY